MNEKATIDGATNKPPGVLLSLSLLVLLGLLAYLLVLIALQSAPLSYVAPIREISMLAGTFIGASLLHESLKPSQYIGAAVMLAGVIGLAYA